MLHGTHDQVHISHLQHQEITLCDRPCPNLQFMIGSYFPTTKKKHFHTSHKTSQKVVGLCSKEWQNKCCKSYVKIFLLQESFSPNKTKLKELKHHPMIKKKEKFSFFLHLLLGEKTVVFVLAQKYPHTFVY